MDKKRIFLLCFFIALLFIAAVPQYPVIHTLIEKHFTSDSSQPIASPRLKSVFQEKHVLSTHVQKENIRILTATGDIIPARSVNFSVLRRNDPLWPYEKVAPLLKSMHSDITFINLETPLLKDCPPTDEGMVFC